MPIERLAVAASRTIILQSHNFQVLRGWIGPCVDSVRRWTEQRGYDYRFLGDEIFDLLPDESDASAPSTETLLNTVTAQADAGSLSIGSTTAGVPVSTVTAMVTEITTCSGKRSSVAVRFVLCACVHHCWDPSTLVHFS